MHGGSSFSRLSAHRALPEEEAAPRAATHARGEENESRKGPALQGNEASSGSNAQQARAGGDGMPQDTSTSLAMKNLQNMQREGGRKEELQGKARMTMRITTLTATTMLHWMGAAV